MSKPGPISAKPLAVLLSDVFADAYAKQGFAARELVTRWAEIAGPEIAVHSEPLKIQWPRPVEGQPQEPATLVLRVEGPAALEIQHASDVILQRVNRFFGWSAVGRLALRQAPLSRRDSAPARACPRCESGGESRRKPFRRRRRGIAGRAGAAWGVDQAKLSLPRNLGMAACHCHNCRFTLANEASSLNPLGVNAPIREQTVDDHAPRLHRRPVADRACRSRRFLAAPPDHGRDGAKRVRCRQAGIAAGHGAWPRQRVGDDHRIRFDDLPALRGLQRRSVPEDQGGLHRHRQGALRVPGIPARHQGRGGLDAGALHRQGRRRRNISRSSTCCSNSRPTG